MLAATPATAVQLTHACLGAGFDAVVPASWGDELIAARVLDRLKRTDGPMLQCSCPRVQDRLAAHGDAIEPMLICTVSPVVAAAEYLRALYAPARPVVTFAGACPGGASDTIDRWIQPAELFAELADRGIVAGAQPTEFDVLPPDRRRFHSEPGGLPCRAVLHQHHPALLAVEVDDQDFVTAVGQHLLGEQRMLLDVAAAVGCACAGAVAGASATLARARVREHEPPRAPSPVVDHAVPVALDADLPRVRVAAPAPARVSAPVEAAPVAALATVSAPSPAPVESIRRRSPPGLPRPVFGAAPRTSRADGRVLPRAYVARRRSSPRGMKSISSEPRASQPVASPRERLWWAAGGLIAGAVLVLLALLVR